MKVVHLTSVHALEDTRILVKECQTLSQKGHQVILIGCGKQPPKNHYGTELKLLPPPKQRAARFTRVQVQIFRKALEENADLYHFHDPELIPVGMLLKAWGKKVIYDVHEDVAGQILNKEWIPPLFRKWISRITSVVEKVGASTFDAMVSTSEEIAKKFPESKTVLVRNYPMAQELFQKQHLVEYAKRPESAAYIGMLSRERGAFEMVRAMEWVNARHPEAKLEFGGYVDGAETYQGLCREAGWKRVIERGRVSRAQVSEILGRARMGLILFYDMPNHNVTEPNKLYEYMSAGIPVIGTKSLWWAKIIQEQQCGLLVDPKNAREIADSIIWLLDHPEEAQKMGARGRFAVEKFYNWEAEAQNLLGLYDRLGGPSA